MFDVEKLIRKNIAQLKPYTSARDEYEGKEGVFLDANENPFGTVNRYPDPYQCALKERIAKEKGIAPDNIFVGNGSDEVIDLALRIFCNPAKDKILICPPTYGMYEVSAEVNDIDIERIPLKGDFQLDVDAITACLQQDVAQQIKIIFLCSPNNPTANLLLDVEKIIQQFAGIVFVDEAYIDFCEQPSLLEKLQQYPNVIVSQTLSKAWGGAAIRLGMAFASPSIINYYNRVKPPYNISALNQERALALLENKAVFEANKQAILLQRAALIKALLQQSCVEKIYPSDANFILVKVTDANKIYNHLITEKVIVRNRHSVVDNCLRITVGTAEENKRLIESLQNIK